MTNSFPRISFDLPFSDAAQSPLGKYTISPKPHVKYPDSGNELADGRLGTVDFKNSAWVGIESKNFEITLNTGGNVNGSVVANVLNYEKAGIFYPTKMNIFCSKNGTSFDKIQTKDFPITKADGVYDFTSEPINNTCAKLKVQFVGTGQFIFISELTIKKNTSSYATGDVRGVTFFYLNGVEQGFPWIVKNISDKTVQTQIKNMLASLRGNGVNWLRLLVSADHFQKTDYPSPSAKTLQNFNALLTLIQDNFGNDFKIELIFVAPRTLKDGQNLGNYVDKPPYTNDKQWISGWMNGIYPKNMSMVGMVLMGGDQAPCGWNTVAKKFTCEGEENATEMQKNHASWIKTMWPWFDAQYASRQSSYKSSYEIIVGNQANEWELLKKSVTWAVKATPSVPVIAAPFYFNAEPGSSWKVYAKLTQEALLAYKKLTTKPLWIDEFGMQIGMFQGKTYTEADQGSFFGGFLAATTCWFNDKQPKFAWVVGNDYGPKREFWHGIMSNFTPTNEPVWRWTAMRQLNLYYTLHKCPNVSSNDLDALENY